jgi:hypothetical protein
MCFTAPPIRPIFRIEAPLANHDRFHQLVKVPLSAAGNDSLYHGWRQLPLQLGKDR